MITSQSDFDNARSRDLILIECSFCHKPYNKVKHYVQANIKHNTQVVCSKKCYSDLKNTGQVKPCSNCQKPVYRSKSGQRKCKSDRHFCDSSCAAKYNNTHKTTGTRRAKLEFWLESQLKELFPNLEVKYSYILPNCCELDIYIPNLALAFELNGIFHYEPIYGQGQLDKIRERDTRKFKHCHDNNISLCVIDTSKQKRFQPKTSQEFLDIIVNLINSKLALARQI